MSNITLRWIMYITKLKEQLCLSLNNNSILLTFTFYYFPLKKKLCSWIICYLIEYHLPVNIHRKHTLTCCNNKEKFSLLCRNIYWSNIFVNLTLFSSVVQKDSMINIPLPYFLTCMETKACLIWGTLKSHPSKNS